MNDAFTFYASFYEAIKNLKKNADRLKAYDAICEYAINGNEPDCEGAVKSVFVLIKPVIDTNLARREAGAKGGKAVSKTEANGKQNASKPQAKRKQPSSDKDIEIDIDIEKDIDIDIDKEHECVSDARARETTHNTPTLEEPTRIPTINVVADECVEKGYRLDFQSIKGFMDYNQSHGWKMDWHEALKKWAEREKERAKKKAEPKKNNFTNFENQHQYDFDALAGVLAQPVGGAG